MDFQAGSIVERISGTAPYNAYGVINYQANFEGAFVFPVVETSLSGRTGQSLPVLAETPIISSELTVTNLPGSAKTLNFSYVADAVHSSDNAATFKSLYKPATKKSFPRS